MERKDYESPTAEEFSALPEEYAAPPEAAEHGPPAPEAEFSPPPEAAEFSAPPADREFTPPGSGGPAPGDGSRRKRRVRRLLYAAAALVLTGLLFRGRAAGPLQPDVTFTPVPTAQNDARKPWDVSPPEPGNVSLPDAAPTPEATEAAAPVSTPRPTPEYEPEVPTCLSYFFGFSAYHHGFIKIFHPEQIVSVTAEIWESNFNTLEWSRELTEEEIASGYWELPPFDYSETYFKYMDRYQSEELDPEVELRVTMTTDDGTTTVYTERASHEQGWSVRWWPEDYEPYFEWQEFYPGCFAVMSYESFTASPDIRMGDYQDAWDHGGICVALELNGVPVSAEDVQILKWEEPLFKEDEHGDYVETGRSVYYTTLVIPLPDGAPPAGTAHFTICQKLDGYDLVWATEQELDYGPE